MSRPRSLRRAASPPGRTRRPAERHLRGALVRNADFRRELHTGPGAQLVAMLLRPGESTGIERHPGVEQALLVLAGSGVAQFWAPGVSPAQAAQRGSLTRMLDPGDLLVVPPGTTHQVYAAHNGPGLRLLSVYTPPEHPAGKVTRRAPGRHDPVESLVIDERTGRARRVRRRSAPRARR